MYDIPDYRYCAPLKTAIHTSGLSDVELRPRTASLDQILAGDHQAHGGMPVWPGSGPHPSVVADPARQQLPLALRGELPVSRAGPRPGVSPPVVFNPGFSPAGDGTRTPRGPYFHQG